MKSGGPAKQAAKPKAAATKKAAAKKSSQTESPGVLQRLANFIGLGETPAVIVVRAAFFLARSKSFEPPSRRSKSASKTKSTSKSSGAASKRAKSATRAKSAKPAPKSGSEKECGQRPEAPRKLLLLARKASPASRTSATKTASRAASNQRVKAVGKRSSAKAAKRQAKTRRKSDDPGLGFRQWQETLRLKIESYSN